MNELCDCNACRIKRGAQPITSSEFDVCKFGDRRESAGSCEHKHPLLNSDCPSCAAKIPTDTSSIGESAPSESSCRPDAKKIVTEFWLQYDMPEHPTTSWEEDLVAYALLRASSSSRLLSNLLAVIHRDGGHYEAEHGTKKAAEDAEKIVIALRSASL